MIHRPQRLPRKRNHSPNCTSSAACERDPGTYEQPQTIDHHQCQHSTKWRAEDTLYQSYTPSLHIVVSTEGEHCRVSLSVIGTATGQLRSAQDLDGHVTSTILAIRVQGAAWATTCAPTRRARRTDPPQNADLCGRTDTVSRSKQQPLTVACAGSH